MKKLKLMPTGRESPFSEDEIIVTKTDLTGRIIYANDVFLRVSRLTTKQVIGQPHSIIRHPEMPRTIFKLLWDTLTAKEEIFAFVINLASNGDHYWVFAHVTPSFDGAGNVIGYHSNRRKPNAEQITKIKLVYQDLLREEQRYPNRKDGMIKTYDHLLSTLKLKDMNYEEYVLAL